MRDASYATKALLVQMNNSSDPAEIRALLSRITGTEIDNSVAAFTPLPVIAYQPGLSKANIVIEVFKTNVEPKKQARFMSGILSNTFPRSRVNFDLSDCDKILRVESEQINPKEIIAIFVNNNFKCEVLQ